MAQQFVRLFLLDVFNGAFSHPYHRGLDQYQIREQLFEFDLVGHDLHVRVQSKQACFDLILLTGDEVHLIVHVQFAHRQWLLLFGVKKVLSFGR